MKKVNIYLKAALLMAFLGLFLLPLFYPSPTNAVESYQEGAVIFSDDFNDGNFNGWTVESGTWVIDSANQLTGIKVGTLKSGRIGNGGGWDNYRLEVDVKNDSGIDEGIGFRRPDSNNGYEVTLRHGTGLYDTPEIILRKTQEGTLTKLFSTKTVPLENKKTYHVKIEVVEEHIQMWVDSTLVFDLTDKDTKVKSGAISLAYWTGDIGIINVHFDNVKLTSLSKLRFPVIFIPGIGGSELKTNQDIFWSKDNGHGGVYSHAYPGGEKVWVNQDEAVKLGDDDYFDILKLKADGQTSEADLSLTGSLTPYGYGDINSFFPDIGYTKDTNFFIFAYDWRKDIRTTQTDLDSLVELAKTKSGQPKVNIVAHSMGGLVARNYISDPARANKVNKLIELGVPHLGSVEAINGLINGLTLSYSFYFLKIPIIPSSELKDIFLNLTSGYELLPSITYYDFYKDILLPYNDERDVDTDKIIGVLSFPQFKILLTNLNLNMNLFDLSVELHSFLDPLLNNPNGVKLYGIVGSGQPTLGQIRETWWITWPIEIIPKTEEIFINGDDTVPLYSASLKSDTKDLSGGAKLYYVDQKHNDLVRSSGTAMQTVKAILDEGDSIPVEVKDQRIDLEGQHLSVDDGELDLYDESGNHTGLDSNEEVEEKIPGTTFRSNKRSRNAFIKKTTPKVKAKVTSKKATKQKPAKVKITIKKYKQDKVRKTVVYRNVPVKTDTKIEVDIDNTTDTSPMLPFDGQLIPPTSEVEGDIVDQTPPQTIIQQSGTQDGNGNYNTPVTVTLNGTDNGSGVQSIEYSLDNGQTIHTYTSPFSINSSSILQVKAIDKLGNEEIPQTINLKINTTSNTTFLDNINSIVNRSTNSPGSLLLPLLASQPNRLLENLKIVENNSAVLGSKFADEDQQTPLNSFFKIISWVLIGLFIILGLTLIPNSTFSANKKPK